MTSMQGLLGITLIVGVAWYQGWRFHKTSMRSAGGIVLMGIGLQLVLASLLLHVDVLQDGLAGINLAVLAVSGATETATAFVFGYLGGGDAPFDTTQPGNSYILAFRALPLVIVFSALSAVFWHWGIMQKVVNGFAFLLSRLFGISGAAGLASASSIFVGMVESPLLVRPFLRVMTASELFLVMTCGMATVAGTVMALYAFFLEGVLENPLSHILIASVISAPAAIMLALLIRPPEKNQNPENELPDDEDYLRYESTLHALTRGTEDGLKLFLNIIAMLLVFVALVALVNRCLGLIPNMGEPYTLQGLLGYVMAPFAWLLGVPWSEAVVAGELLGVKVVINELFAFIQLSQLPEGTLGDQSRLIVSYALCGFANLGSLGIMLGGLCAMCPERSRDFIQLAPLSVWSGLLASCLTGAVVGLLA